MKKEVLLLGGVNVSKLWIEELLEKLLAGGARHRDYKDLVRAFGGSTSFEESAEIFATVRERVVVDFTDPAIVLYSSADRVVTLLHLMAAEKDLRPRVVI